MQDSLFPEETAGANDGSVPRMTNRRTPRGEPDVSPHPADTEVTGLAAALASEIRLGTSSWGFPGWAGLVWAGAYTTTQLARQGLSAYARHPLLRTVSLDRAFYKPLSASEYAGLAAQVPDDFRFVVKAPSLVSDAMVRDRGHGMRRNTSFLDPDIAVRDFFQPALKGLGSKIGAMVFQLSPLHSSMLSRIPEVLDRLSKMLAALPPLDSIAPDGVVAVEVRNHELATPGLADVLRSAGARLIAWGCTQKCRPSKLSYPS